MDPPARMLRLLSLLQARPNWTGPDLASRLGVTPRTLRRDVSRLRVLGYPVEALSGPAGGYQLARGGALPPLLLDDEEAIAVALGLRTAAGGGLAGLEDAAIAALAKIEQVLPARLRDRLTAIDKATVRLRPSETPGTALDTDLLVTTAQACRRSERMRFDYVDSAGRGTERHVEPLQLVFASRRWYLVARDRDRDAWRTFRVDRIRRPVLTGLRFEHVDPPDAAALVAEGLAVSSYRWQAKVLLKIKHEEAVRVVSPTVGVVTPTRGGTLLRIGADDLPWIARYLSSLACRFTVLEPVELREALRAHLKNLLSETA
ncbi:MAG TPA: YafY family protein [Acidimicrobiia bacterium]|nr:YafY family protein [Acidimicrobiia bacterium]